MQNITWGAMESHERKLPRVPDIVSHIMQTSGGACVHLNYFLKLLLEFLKFQVEICSSEVMANKLPNNHLVLVVKLNSVDELTASVKEDAFLIDVGMGRPIVSPIDLNNLPHRGRAGGFDFEVRFNTERQLYERILYRGCAIKGKFVSYTCTVILCSFKNSVNKNFRNHQPTVWLKSSMTCIIQNN